MSLIWYRGLGELGNSLLLSVLPGSLLKMAPASPAMHERKYATWNGRALYVRFFNWFVWRDETELIGQDGQIYKGRFDERMPDVPTVWTSFHCIEKWYGLLIILYFISGKTSIRFLSASFYFFVRLIWSSLGHVIKEKWCCLNRENHTTTGVLIWMEITC